MKYGIKFTRPDTKPTIIVIELVIIRIWLNDFRVYNDDCDRMNKINVIQNYVIEWDTCSIIMF